MLTLLLLRTVPQDHNGQVKNPIHGLMICLMLVIDCTLTTIVLNTL
jgi:hypothetical protein